jgi:hypothetical protein
MAKSKRQLNREIAEVLQRKPSKVVASARPKSRVAHSTISRQQLNELIASDDPASWSVARDHALERNLKDKIVLLDMARALDTAPADLKVTKGRPYSKSYQVELGNQEYVVVPDDDTAYKIAIASVTDDLKDDPSMFDQEFIGRHIDQKKLKKAVYAAHMDDDYVAELARHQVDDFWDLARRLDVDKAVPDTDEEGALMEPTRKQIAAVEEAYAEDRAKAPMEYFTDIYGHEEALKRAAEAAGIDVKAAAEDAVDTDGWQHFLASYDGNSHDTETGLVYWRVN